MSVDDGKLAPPGPLGDQTGSLNGSFAGEVEYVDVGADKPLRVKKLSMSQVDEEKDLMDVLQQKGRSERWAIDRSEIEISGEKFDSGSGGEIFKVKWRGLDCVAKTCPLTVSKQVLVDLANEIQVLSTLRHPNLVMFLGASFAPGKPPIMLMEYCSGGSLEKKLCKLSGQASKLRSKDALMYTYELALAINFLHNCHPPVVHRDLKPSNVLLTKSNNIKVTDFGLSKFIPKKAPKQHDRYTMTGETGSYRFMAPEVFKHEDYNEKVDVYSFGLIVYWMLSGQRPFAEIFDPIEAARKASEGIRKPNPGLIRPPGLRKILASCWNIDQDARPDFKEILAELNEYVDGSGVKKHEGCLVS